MSGWQPITTAPKDGTWIWAYWPAGIHEDRQGPASWEEFPEGFRWGDPSGSRGRVQPSHWMALPEPPADSR